MTNSEYQILLTLSKKCKTEESLSAKFGVESRKSLDVLVSRKWISEDIGDGFVGGLKTYTITSKGLSAITGYCCACECNPCDCDWGH